MDRLDWLDGLNRLNRLNRLDRLDGLNRLNRLDRLNGMDGDGCNRPKTLNFGRQYRLVSIHQPVAGGQIWASPRRVACRRQCGPFTSQR